MGCDIHLEVEKLTADGWEHLERPLREYSWGARREWYGTRNYDLFALLADVRNDDGVTPWSAQRGLPEDVSPEARKLSDDWGIDGHSHSWFTLRELIAFAEQAQAVPQSGLIDDIYPDGSTGRAADIARHATETGEFPWEWRGKHVSYCQGISGPNAWRHKRVEWTVSLADVMGQEWLDALDLLKTLTLDDGSDVRIVFWFDN